MKSISREMLKIYNMHILFFIFTLIGVSVFGVSAQSPIPDTDDDINNVVTKIPKFTSLAEQCSSTECPDFDCKSAQKTFNDLRDARKYMRYTHFWLSRASETSMEHFRSLAKDGKLTSKRLAKIQTIVAYQEYVTNIASTMLDIASASANLKDLSKNVTKLAEMSGSELIKNLDTLYEGMKDFESADKAVRSGGNAQSDSRPKMFSLGSDELDNMKSTLSDLKTVVEEAYKNGKDWRGAFRTSKGRAAVGNIIGRVAMVYAKTEINERKERIKSLANDLKATDFAQSGAFDDMQRIRTRRNKAEDAFNALDKLLVIRSGGSGGTLTRCFQKRKDSCPMFDLDYVSKLRFDGAYEIFDTRDPDGGRNRHYGEALRFFNSKLLVEVPALLNAVPELTASTNPSLQLGKTTFKPGTQITVKFTAPACYRSSSWVGIVPSAISHGSEEINLKEKIGLMSFLKRQERGEMTFKAPDKSGQYDIRMNNSGTGREVKSIGFSVESNSPGVNVLGRVWNESESGWTGTWTRRGNSSVFDAVWRKGGGIVRALLSIRITGNRVSVSRTRSTDGYNCNYSGTLSANRRTVTGRMSCLKGGRVTPRNAQWQATITR